MRCDAMQCDALRCDAMAVDVTCVLDGVGLIWDGMNGMGLGSVGDAMRSVAI